MSRCYEVTFRVPGGDEVTTRGYGNVRGTAERSARSRLRELGHDPKRCSTLSVEYVPEAKR